MHLTGLLDENQEETDIEVASNASDNEADHLSEKEDETNEVHVLNFSQEKVESKEELKAAKKTPSNITELTIFQTPLVEDNVYLYSRIVQVLTSGLIGKKHATLNSRRGNKVM